MYFNGEDGGGMRRNSVKEELHLDEGKKVG
jgi:hypothetical protein